MRNDDCQVIGLTPFGRPDAHLLSALCRSGAVAVLDLGSDPHQAQSALQEAAASVPEFGVLIPSGLSLAPDQLPENVSLVVLSASVELAPWSRWPVYSQVTSVDEATAAIDAGAVGLIAKGNESGGRVGEQSTFVFATGTTKTI